MSRMNGKMEGMLRESPESLLWLWHNVVNLALSAMAGICLIDKSLNKI